MKKKIVTVIKIIIIGLFMVAGIYYKSPLFSSCALVSILVFAIKELNKK